jgi:hypothetical protein
VQGQGVCELSLWPVFDLRDNSDQYCEKGFAVWAAAFVACPHDRSRGVSSAMALPVLFAVVVALRFAPEGETAAGVFQY